MALTVNAAFEQFRNEYVDLDSKQVATARNSRDFLVEQLNKLPEAVTNFPWLTGNRLLFGSFARRTKIRPLDDIDLMIVMHGGGGTEISTGLLGYGSKVLPGTMQSPVRLLCDADGYVNSNRVLFKIRDSLSQIPHYDQADLHKNCEAVTLKLKSYPWNFDIVPTFGVTDGVNPLVYYLIPDGRGHWKRTDPRRDDTRVTAANQQHGGLVLPIMRLLKYWNRRSQSPTMMSYWLESIALSVFEEIEPVTSVRFGLARILIHAPEKIQSSCPDPKELGPNLDDNLDLASRQKIIDAFQKAGEMACNALIHEYENEDHSSAIIEWQKIFGALFPKYG